MGVKNIILNIYIKFSSCFRKKQIDFIGKQEVNVDIIEKYKDL